MLEGVQQTVSTNALGQFSGDAKGFVNYSTGKGCLIPNKLPQKGTSFNFSFSVGEAKRQDVLPTIPDTSQKLAFNIGTGVALQPNSITLEIPLTSKLGDTVILVVTDNGSGGLIDAFGNIQGSIDYNTGDVQCTALILTSYFYERQVVTYSSSPSVSQTPATSQPTATPKISFTSKLAYRWL